MRQAPAREFDERAPVLFVCAGIQTREGVLSGTPCGVGYAAGGARVERVGEASR
jgi:hypothetical protein